MERVGGTLLGVLFSLAAIGLWILLNFIGFIAGIAGALMGILFFVGYKLLNKTDNSKYPVIAACMLIVVEVIVAELITIAIYAGLAEISFSEAMGFGEYGMGMWVIIDISVGLLLSFICFGGYLHTNKRKKPTDENRISKY